jgi:hypothetical protein
MPSTVFAAFLISSIVGVGTPEETFTQMHQSLAFYLETYLHDCLETPDLILREPSSQRKHFEPIHSASCLGYLHMASLTAPARLSGDSPQPRHTSKPDRTD